MSAEDSCGRDVEQPLVLRAGVHRCLVTGSDDDLQAFHLVMCWAANSVDRRGQTILYTVFAEDLETFISVARKTGVTVQQREETDTPPYWRLVVRGVMEPWRPKP